MVRVSGEGSADYSGEDGTCERDLQLVEDALGGEPAEYEVAEVVSDGVTAFFRRTQSDGGELRAEILTDGKLVVESTAYVESGSVAYPTSALFDQGSFD